MTTPPTILIAVDADEGADRAVEAALALFGTDADYRFAHVAEPVPMTPPGSVAYPATPAAMPAGVAPVISEAVSPEDTIESARSVASRAAADAGIDHAAATGLLGDPAEELIELAVRIGADAIVVTPHDHGWIERLFHSSVSDEIERNSPVPVLVVPTPR